MWGLIAFLFYFCQPSSPFSPTLFSIHPCKERNSNTSLDRSPSVTVQTPPSLHHAATLPTIYRSTPNFVTCGPPPRFLSSLDTSAGNRLEPYLASISPCPLTLGQSYHSIIPHFAGDPSLHQPELAILADPHPPSSNVPSLGVFLLHTPDSCFLLPCVPPA